MDLGDLVELRQLRPDQCTWQGIVFEASVASINRAGGSVTLRCDGLRLYHENLVFNVIWKPQGAHLFLRFAEQSLSLAERSSELPRLAPCDRNSPQGAITSIGSGLDEDGRCKLALPRQGGRRFKRGACGGGRDSWRNQWLGRRVAESRTAGVWISRSPFFRTDRRLNPQQAVQSIIWGKHATPFLISGPPGTGKTKTLVRSPSLSVFVR